MSQEANLTFSHLGERLKKARVDAGLTQDDLARRWRLSGNYVWMLESGQKPFPDKHLKGLEELEREGQKRARSELEEESHLSETPPVSGEELWRRRALAAEKKLSDLRSGLRSILELSADLPQPAPKEKPMSVGINSTSLSEAEVSAGAAERAWDSGDPVSGRKPRAGETSDDKHATSGVVSPGSTGKQSPPKPAQG